MVNYWLILGPIGMIAVGLITMIYWYRKHKVSPHLFAFGALLWVIPIILKGLMDSMLTTSIYDYFNSTVPAASLLLLSIIIGLRTGFFESGISYLIMKLKLKKVNWEESIAIGIGFGATEALILGALSLLSMSLLMNPVLIQDLSEVEQQIIDLIFDQSTLIVFASWIERTFVLFIHVFATVLVVKSITSKKLKYLWLSIAYKAIVDLPVPYFQTLIGSGDLLMTYLTELYIIGVGIASLYGLKWLKKKEKKPRKRKK